MTPALSLAPPPSAPSAPPAPDAHAMRAWRVLAVDDEALSLTLLARLLERMGHVVRKAASGAEAIAVINEGWPDIVLTDLHMPGIDGCTVAHHAKARGKPWLPVIMLTAVSHDDETLVRALEAGADDYLIKPVAFPVLRAKLRALSRTLELQREIARQHDELKSYRALEDDNNLMAGHLIEQLSARACAPDAAVQHWVRAADGVSGDMVMAARSPGGALHVMLADATGHGLPAAISLLPLLKIFHAMTVKGYGVGEIARELNNTAREHLPVGRFVAATLVSVDARYHLVQVWNGSNPPLHLIADDGRLLFTAHSRHLALGIADRAEFSGVIEQFEYGTPCQAVACSDGALEVTSRAGAPLGDAGWLSLLRASAPSARMASVKQALGVVKPAGGYEDDASVVIIDCALEAACVTPPATFETPSIPQGRWRSMLTLSESELKRLDPVPMLLGFINQMDGIKPHAGNLFVILSELFNNALDHGLLGLDSRMKQGPGGFERWMVTRAARLEGLEAGSIEIMMKIRVEGSRHVLIIVVKDSGAGFDWNKISASQSCDVLHGRGVSLVRQLCSRVEYRGNGNDVKVFYDLGEAQA